MRSIDAIPIKIAPESCRFKDSGKSAGLTNASPSRDVWDVLTRFLRGSGDDENNGKVLGSGYR